MLRKIPTTQEIKPNITSSHQPEWTQIVSNDLGAMLQP